MNIKGIFSIIMTDIHFFYIKSKLFVYIFFLNIKNVSVRVIIHINILLKEPETQLTFFNILFNIVENFNLKTDETCNFCYR